MIRIALTTVSMLSCTISVGFSQNISDVATPDSIQSVVATLCLDCHDTDTQEAGLDLSKLAFNLDDPATFDSWVSIHDRVRAGEMPPPEGPCRPIVPIGWSQHATPSPPAPADPFDTRRFLHELGQRLATTSRNNARDGRAQVRRLNRLEYENALRQVLHAPWLQISDRLPDDGVAHLFNKSGSHLDVSHVQITRYFEVAQKAIRAAIEAAAHPQQTRRFYAREERSMQNYLRYRFGQTAATRSIVPLLDLKSEPEVIRGNQPITVGADDPARREREAMGVFSGTYNATTKYDFTNFSSPTDGHYKLRLKSYTFTAAPFGASGGDDHGLTGGRRQWWRPDRTRILPGLRSEPITLYALAGAGDSRWLTTFDAHPAPTVYETTVALRAGESIRPDAARLVRTRPGWSGNPNATKAGVPGFALNWLEVEGPQARSWPPDSYRAIMGDLPFNVTENGVEAITNSPNEAAARIVAAFCQRVLPEGPNRSVLIRSHQQIYQRARELDVGFTDAIISTLAAICVSPDFLYLDPQPGRLSPSELQTRLAYFLWNSPPDPDFPCTAAVTSATVDRMLDDPRSQRFVETFLDFWLDLRDINANAPDAALYPDYYLDELLTESSLLESQYFFRELLDRNLPIRTLVDSDFTFVNERLATHYGLPPFEGVQLRRIAIPKGSPRGGFLTQAAILRVTANGTTTSPVLRGAWIMERLLGLDIPPPPSGIDAIEPDIRGAKTIREQLVQHRDNDGCYACHAKFDPTGFALEQFDVAGGWRTRYRGLSNHGSVVDGLGKNGHAFRFRLAHEVETYATLPDGKQLDDVRALRGWLAGQDRQLARNLLHRLIVYATGASVSFGDRAEVEELLDAAAPQYGVRTLVYELVQSPLFSNK